MRQLLIALQFLTVLPIKIKGRIKNKDFGRSLFYFPVAGLTIGLLLSIAAYLLLPLPKMVSGAIILILSLLITGAIHLDGFADTCDGFCGGRSKEKILEIMRDSSIGAMGVIGVTSILLLKFVSIINIPQENLWKAIIIALVFSRWSQVLACYFSKYARTDGKAKQFVGHAEKKELIAGGAFTFTSLLFLAGSKGILLFIIFYMLTRFEISYINRKICGMTGDTIGAISEATETGLLLSSIFLFN